MRWWILLRFERKDEKRTTRWYGVKRVERGTRNERRWSVVTANYTIVGRLTIEQLRAASEQTE